METFDLIEHHAHRGCGCGVVEIHMLSFFKAKFAQVDVQRGNDAVPLQARFNAVHGATVERDQRSSRLGGFNQPGNIAADSGDAGHLGDTPAV